MTASRNVQSLGWTRRDFAATFQRMLRERYVEIGAEVRRLRMDKGYSQEALAAEAGLSVKTISRIESPPKDGPFETRGGTYRKLAPILGVTVEHLRRPLTEAATVTIAGDGSRASDAPAVRPGAVMDGLVDSLERSRPSEDEPGESGEDGPSNLSGGEAAPSRSRRG